MERKNEIDISFGLRLLLAGLLAMVYLATTGDAFTEILFLLLVIYDLVFVRRLQ